MCAGGLGREGRGGSNGSQPQIHLEIPCPKGCSQTQDRQAPSSPGRDSQKPCMGWLWVGPTAPRNPPGCTAEIAADSAGCLLEEGDPDRLALGARDLSGGHEGERLSIIMTLGRIRTT